MRLGNLPKVTALASISMQLESNTRAIPEPHHHLACDTSLYFGTYEQKGTWTEI